MPIRMTLPPTFAADLEASDRALMGMWVCSGSPLVAEIAAGSGLDWLLIDGEHSPNSLESILAQLQATHGYPVHTLVRPPVNDTVVIKQYLDLGVQNLLIGQGVEVITADDRFMHVSGHPARDELAAMYQMVRPQIAVPVHGEPVEPVPRLGAIGRVEPHAALPGHHQPVVGLGVVTLGRHPRNAAFGRTRV